jgi:hypothetical protein
MNRRLFYVVLLTMLSGSLSTLKAQVTVKASIDSTHILIGDQLKLLLEIEKPKDLDVEFPQIPDSFSSHIEVVNRSKIDTIKLDSKVREKLVQSLSLTSFDSGIHQIPSFFFKMKDGKMLDSAATLALAFEVLTMKVDTTKGPVDIKVPYSAPVTLKEIIPYILGIILIGAIVFFAFYYIKWKKKNVPLFVKPVKPEDPPHVIALRELERIKTQKLWQHEKVKQYYSEVSDTLRIYIEKRFDVPAMEFTSAETLGTFRQNKNMVDDGTLDQLQQILSLADLVKFAKYTPLPDDNNLVLDNAYTFVNRTKKEEVIVQAPEKNITEPDKEEVAVK